MTLDDNASPPKRTMPPAMTAAARLHAFKPGLVGALLCEAIKRNGQRCKRVAVKGLIVRGERRCLVHGANTLRAIRRKGRPRCEAWNVKKPRHQCEHPAKQNGLCGFHLLQIERGKQVARTAQTILVPRVPMGGSTNTAKRAIEREARPRKRAPASGAYARTLAAPRELTQAPVWREACEHERAALVHAWEARETSPGVWLALVREIMTREAE